MGGGNTAEYGGGQVLAAVGGDTLAAYWETGSAPENVANVDMAVFPGPRLFFNLDNDPNAGNNGVNDLANLTPQGRQALISAIAIATPLTAVPEPSTSLLAMASLGLLGLRRRR